MGSRRVGLPWACEPQLEGCGLRSTHAVSTSPRNAPVSASSLRAPLRPKHCARSAPSSRLAAPPGARRLLSRVPAPTPGLWESAEFKSPDVKLAQAKTLKISSGRLQERRVKGLTSLEKLCDKLGGSAEWPGPNRRFLAQEAGPERVRGGFAAPTNSPFAPWSWFSTSPGIYEPGRRPRSRSTCRGPHCLRVPDGGHYASHPGVPKSRSERYRERLLQRRIRIPPGVRAEGGSGQGPPSPGWNGHWAGLAAGLF